jgi:hypothetical protein
LDLINVDHILSQNSSGIVSMRGSFFIRPVFEPPTELKG